ncbi:MAG: S41 family peptidase [Clostridia bacterium]|nr:S41 family peptidase [Clostridia bacterium]
MKRNWIRILAIVLMLGMLSGCTMISPSTLESMFGSKDTTAAATAVPTEAVSSGEDTVTISLEEYQRLNRFAELNEIYDLAHEYFYKDIDDEKMLDEASRGLLTGLDDPYSYYYNPEEYAKMWEDDEGVYGGIGILISANYKTQICTISRVFQGSPAEAAGVHRGDILYRVGEDLYVTADTLEDAVKIMRGEPGSSVDVAFLRNGEEISFTIPREIINVNQIESTMLDEKVGYIALYQFAGQCEQEFEKALNELLGKGMKGLIIDLRDNGGGWVDQARYIGDLFMDEGELCYLRFKDGTEDHSYYLTQNGKVNVKIVVLVNENSASSSEILTGALRDCADAVIVGTKTFGKGIVQNVIPVGSRGAGFQITVAEYFSPKGNAVHDIGIEPDVLVELPEGDNGMYGFADVKQDIQLAKAYETILEKMK